MKRVIKFFIVFCFGIVCGILVRDITNAGVFMGGVIFMIIVDYLQEQVMGCQVSFMSRDKDRESFCIRVSEE